MEHQNQKQEQINTNPISIQPASYVTPNLPAEEFVKIPPQSKKSFSIVIIVVVMLFLSISSISAYYFVIRKQQDKLQASTITPTTLPLSTTIPTSGIDETSNGNLYTNEKLHYSLKYPPTSILEENADGVWIDKQININVSPSSISDCRGDCPWSDESSVNITIDSIPVKKITGYRGSMFGNPQRYQRVEINKNNMYYSIVLYALKYDNDLPFDDSKIKEIPAEQIKSFEQILSTFKFISTAPSVNQNYNQNQNTNGQGINLPVNVLETTFGIDQGTVLSYPKTIIINASSQIKDQIAAYGVAGQTIIGPMGCTGKGQIGANGYIDVELIPPETLWKTGSKITFEAAPTGSINVLSNAAPYFSWIRENWNNLDVPIPTPSPIQRIITTIITPHLVKYSLPETSNGLLVSGVAFSDADKHKEDRNWSFINMEITYPIDQKSITENLLDIFIDQKFLLDK